KKENTKYYDYDKYRYLKRKLVRVKNWKTNFNNLTNLGVYFTHQIEKIKSVLSLSDKELSLECKYKPNSNTCTPLSNNVAFRYHDIIKHYHTFINTLKHKNLDQAAYIIYEITELGAILSHTSETIVMFNYPRIQEFLKRYNKYKPIFIKLKDIYSKAKHDYNLTLNILTHNYTDNNFCKFMLKFVETHKLVTHVYFNMDNLRFKCIDSGSSIPESINPYCTKLTSTIL
ncbi:hypothetical protein BCO_0018404, partial (plasmid) [Borrelia coriaceae ATCC 43381]